MRTRASNRAPTAGGRSPLERHGATRGGSVEIKTGLDYLSEAQRRDQDEHDRAVREMDEDTLLAIAADLGRRRAWNRADHEQRWIMNRLAGALRRLDKLQSFQP